MLEILSYDFFQNALIANILCSIICGIIGTVIVIKRIVFISGGISHISFGGIGIAHYLGINLFLGALIFSIFSSIIIAKLNEQKNHRQDSYIGIFWTLGTAIGILFIYQKPGYVPDLFSYLFGNILTISKNDLNIMILLISIISIIFIIFFKEFLALVFEKNLLLVKGIPFQLFNISLYLIITITIITLINLVGMILVIALLTIPPNIALIYTNSINKIIYLSIAISFIFIFIGLNLSYFINIPTGPAIILPASTSLGLCKIISKYSN